MTSNREKKRIISRGVRDLVSRGGWNTSRPEPGMTGMMRSAYDRVHDALVDEAYSETDVCPDCLQARQEARDQTALCEKHMMEAFGMAPNQRKNKALE